MTKLNGALIICTLCTVLAGNAHAGDVVAFDTTFTYNKTDSLSANYVRFERTAEKACRAEISRDGRQPLFIRSKLEANCRDVLLTKVVKATRSEILIAYHKQKMDVAQG